MPPASDDRESNEPNMYDVLNISSTASSTEVRRAYRNLITKARLSSPMYYIISYFARLSVPPVARRVTF